MKVEISPIAIDNYSDFVIAAHKETFRITFGSEITSEFLENEFTRMRKDEVNDRNSVVGAFANGKIVGLAIHEIRSYSNGTKYGWIHFYYVASDARRLGVGSKLVDYSAKYFSSLGLKEFKLRTGENNKVGQTFYLNKGFIHLPEEDSITLNGVKELMFLYPLR